MGREHHFLFGEEYSSNSAQIELNRCWQTAGRPVSALLTLVGPKIYGSLHSLLASGSAFIVSLGYS